MICNKLRPTLTKIMKQKDLVTIDFDYNGPNTLVCTRMVSVYEPFIANKKKVHEFVTRVKKFISCPSTVACINLLDDGTFKRCFTESSKCDNLTTSILKLLPCVMVWSEVGPVICKVLGSEYLGTCSREAPGNDLIFYMIWLMGRLILENTLQSVHMSKTIKSLWFS